MAKNFMYTNKRQMQKPKKDSYLRISEAKWLLNLKALYILKAVCMKKVLYFDPICLIMRIYFDLFN